VPVFDDEVIRHARRSQEKINRREGYSGTSDVFARAGQQELGLGKKDLKFRFEGGREMTDRRATKCTARPRGTN